MKKYFPFTASIFWVATLNPNSSQLHYKNVSDKSCVIIFVNVKVPMQCNCNLTEICFARESMLLVSVRVAQKVLPQDAIVIEHNRFYQNIIFSAPDYQLSMMETSVLGFMRFDNIGFATSALA